MTADSEYPGELSSFYTFDFRTTRILDTSFLPSVLELKLGFAAISEVVTEELMANYFSRIRVYVDNVLDNSVMFSMNNPFARSIFWGGSEKIGNFPIALPVEPVEHLIAPVIQSKFTSICEGNVAFYSCEIKSNNKSGFSYFNDIEPDELLPTPEEWFDGRANYFNVPWWKRCDLTSFDTAAAEGEDLTKTPEWAIGSSFDYEDSDPSKKPAEIIKFNPVVYDGGKKQ